MLAMLLNTRYDKQNYSSNRWLSWQKAMTAGHFFRIENYVITGTYKSLHRLVKQVQASVRCMKD